MSEEGDPLSPDARDALEEELARPPLTPEELARLRERVEREIPSGGEPGARRAGSRLHGPSLGAGVLLGALGALLIARLWPRASVVEVRQVTVYVVDAAVPPAAPPPPVALAADASPAHDDAGAREPDAQVRRAPSGAELRSWTQDALAREQRWIETARSAVLRRAWAAALAALEEHQRAFPHGQLAEERDALRVEALAGSGRGVEAWARAQVFLRSYPQSMLRATVQSVLNGLSER